MPYSIEEHKHRFAAWAAGRAASVNRCRFTVEQGKQILEGAHIYDVSCGIQNLPEPNGFDEKHREWRNDVIQAAQQRQLTFTHGVAAKLINMYLKSIFVCSNHHEDPRVKAIHPPIDSLLLDALYRGNVGDRRHEWQAARRVRWSKLDSVQYENVISAIKQTVPQGNGIWQIEEYWQGFQ